MKRGQSKNLIDETGNTYGRLTVIKKSEPNRFGHTMWWCQCQCGTEKAIAGGTLRSPTGTKSCGCLQKDTMFNKRTGNSVYQIMLNNIKTDCRLRGHAFDLDLDDIKRISILPCTYCKRNPYEYKCRYQRKNSVLPNECLLLNGIDRVIPSEGYTKENIAPCCKYCNRAKSDLSLEEFKNLIELIYKNYCNEINN